MSCYPVDVQSRKKSAVVSIRQRRSRKLNVDVECGPGRGKVKGRIVGWGPPPTCVPGQTVKLGFSCANTPPLPVNWLHGNKGPYSKGFPFNIGVVSRGFHRPMRAKQV